MSDYKKSVNFRMPLKLINIVKIISIKNGNSFNEELIRLVELGVKSFMNQSEINEKLILHSDENS